MYLHVGSGEIVAVEKIVGIFSASGFLENPRNRLFLEKARASGEARPVDTERVELDPVSFLILADGRVLRSPIAASSLVRRLRSCRTFFDDQP